MIKPFRNRKNKIVAHGQHATHEIEASHKQWGFGIVEKNAWPKCTERDNQWSHPLYILSAHIYLKQ